jgi:hypothetical protein
MTPKAIRRTVGYATGIIVSLAFILFVQHWIVAVILIPGWCLALWHHRATEREISELQKQRDERNHP